MLSKAANVNKNGTKADKNRVLKVLSPRISMLYYFTDI